jgi:hypothetical protein
MLAPNDTITVRTWLNDNWFKGGILFTLLIGILLIAYYFTRKFTPAINRTSRIKDACASRP